jgi:hypothetical protein
MNRRAAITLLGGAAAWPLSARAEQGAKLPTIGFLGQSTRSAASEWVAASLPVMALTAIRYGAQNSVAIGGTADITGLEAAGGSIENDPQPT